MPPAVRAARFLLSGFWLLVPAFPNQRPAASHPKPVATPTTRSPFASHPDSALEWWYWTGHLADSRGRAYGFQVTFFRLRDFHLAHFAWSDVAAKRFTFDEKAHLGLPGIAGASEERLDVFNEDWRAGEEAGGRVTDYQDAPVDMFRGQIVASNGHLHRAMIEAIGRAQGR